MGWVWGLGAVRTVARGFFQEVGTHYNIPKWPDALTSVCKAFKKYLQEASYIIRMMKILHQEANKLMLGNEVILDC
jgi:hypothetical protein